MKRALVVLASSLFLIGADGGGCGSIQIPNCVTVQQGGASTIKVCNADVACSSSCQFGCNSDGSCMPQNCSSSCTFGCNSDGSCRNQTCSSSCTLGCNSDGSCRSSNGNLITLNPQSLTIPAGFTRNFTITAQMSLTFTVPPGVTCTPVNSLSAGGVASCVVATSTSSVSKDLAIVAHASDGETETEQLHVTVTSSSGNLPDGSSCSSNPVCTSGLCQNGFCHAQPVTITQFTETCLVDATFECFSGTAQTRTGVSILAGHPLVSNAGEVTCLVQNMDHTLCTCAWIANGVTMTGQSTGPTNAQCFWNGPPQ